MVETDTPPLESESSGAIIDMLNYEPVIQRYDSLQTNVKIYPCDICMLVLCQKVVYELRCRAIITKTYQYNFDPLNPHFYIVKLGFTGIYIIFPISAQNHRLLVHIRASSARRF